MFDDRCLKDNSLNVKIFNGVSDEWAEFIFQNRRASHQGQVCNVGLWKHGRHPNYFGEIQFWWGIWVMYASLYGFDWCVFCPITMTALFLGISIPLMEKRQLQNKPDYKEYRKQTRLLI